MSDDFLLGLIIGTENASKNNYKPDVALTELIVLENVLISESEDVTILLV